MIEYQKILTVILVKIGCDLLKRNVDNTGRVVIPKEYRNMLGIDLGSELTISIEENKIILQKESKSCMFCKSDIELIKFKNQFVCHNCPCELNRCFILEK